MKLFISKLLVSNFSLNIAWRIKNLLPGDAVTGDILQQIPQFRHYILRMP